MAVDIDPDLEDHSIDGSPGGAFKQARLSSERSDSLMEEGTDANGCETASPGLFSFSVTFVVGSSVFVKGEFMLVFFLINLLEILEKTDKQGRSAIIRPIPKIKNKPRTTVPDLRWMDFPRRRSTSFFIENYTPMFYFEKKNGGPPGNAAGRIRLEAGMSFQDYKRNKRFREFLRVHRCELTENRLTPGVIVPACVGILLNTPSAHQFAPLWEARIREMCNLHALDEANVKAQEALLPEFQLEAFRRVLNPKHSGSVDDIGDNIKPIKKAEGPASIVVATQIMSSREDVAELGTRIAQVLPFKSSAGQQAGCPIFIPWHIWKGQQRISVSGKMSNQDRYLSMLRHLQYISRHEFILYGGFDLRFRSNWEDPSLNWDDTALEWFRAQKSKDNKPLFECVFASINKKTEIWVSTANAGEAIKWLATARHKLVHGLPLQELEEYFSCKEDTAKLCSQPPRSGEFQAKPDDIILVVSAQRPKQERASQEVVVSDDFASAVIGYRASSQEVPLGLVRFPRRQGSFRRKKARDIPPELIQALLADDSNLLKRRPSLKQRKSEAHRGANATEEELKKDHRGLDQTNRLGVCDRANPDERA